MGFLKKRDRKFLKWERANPLRFEEIVLHNGETVARFYFPVDNNEKTEHQKKQK